MRGISGSCVQRESLDELRGTKLTCSQAAAFKLVAQQVYGDDKRLPEKLGQDLRAERPEGCTLGLGRAYASGVNVTEIPKRARNNGCKANVSVWHDQTRYKSQSHSCTMSSQSTCRPSASDRRHTSCTTLCDLGTFKKARSWLQRSQRKFHGYETDTHKVRS